MDGTNIDDPSSYTIASTELPSYQSAELDYQGQVSLAKSYSVGSHASTFEMGFEVRDAHKLRNENDQFFNTVNTYTLSQVLSSSTNPNYYDTSFVYGPLSNYNKIRSLVAGALQTGFTPSLDKDRIVSDPATWDTSERVYAGYLMDKQGHVERGSYSRTDPVTGGSG